MLSGTVTQNRASGKVAGAWKTRAPCRSLRPSISCGPSHATRGAAGRAETASSVFSDGIVDAVVAPGPNEAAAGRGSFGVTDAGTLTVQTFRLSSHAPAAFRSPALDDTLTR